MTRIADRARRSSAPAAPVAVEPLESRRLYSTAKLVSGTLTVTGTSGDNQITLTTLPAAPGGVSSQIRVVTSDGLDAKFVAQFVSKVVVNAGAGNDVVNTAGVAKPTTLNGGAGNDTLTSGPDADALNGGPDNDTLDGGLGSDFISGNEGRDRVSYASRTNGVTVSLDDKQNDGETSEADDVRSNVEEVAGGSGNDTLTGSVNPNVLLGNGGNDKLYGGGGTDFLDGGTGNDQLYGQAGDDLLDGGTGTDYLSGGIGTDTVSYALRTTAVTVTLDGVNNDGAAGEKDDVETDVENLIGGAGNDTLTGSAGDNRIEGGAGNDLISGGNGNDTLVGGPGKDRLYGQVGNDILYGSDTEADYLDGGVGTDKAQKDAKDAIFSIESFI